MEGPVLIRGLFYGAGEFPYSAVKLEIDKVDRYSACGLFVYYGKLAGIGIVGNFGVLKHYNARFLGYGCDESDQTLGDITASAVFEGIGKGDSIICKIKASYNALKLVNAVSSRDIGREHAIFKFGVFCGKLRSCLLVLAVDYRYVMSLRRAFNVSVTCILMEILLTVRTASMVYKYLSAVLGEDE